MKKLLLILCCIVFFFGNVFSQDQHLIDSLQTQLKQLQGERTELRNNTPSIRDSSIALILNALCWAYMNNNPDKALDYAKQTLALSEQIVWKRGIGIAYNSIGSVCNSQGNYPQALKNYFAALKIFEETGNKKGIGSAYNNIGNVYQNQGNYPKTIENYFAALKIYEETGNKKGIAITYNNIGIIYYYQSSYSETLKNYFAALKKYEEIGDKNGVATAYNNIGIVYFEQGDYSEALKNYFAALKIEEEIGDKEIIAAAYTGIGSVYFNQSNYPEALKNFFTVLKICEETGNKHGIAKAYNNIGIVYTRLNRAKEGKAWLQKGLALSTEIGAKEDIKENYSGFAKADSALGNYKSAFENYKLYILYKDSLFNEENIKKTTQQQMQYEFDKKQIADSLKVVEERKVNEVKFKQEKQQRYFLYSSLALVLLFAGFMFNRFRVTQKQKTIIEHHHKEITDSINYAERIQRSLLASKEMLDENLAPPKLPKGEELAGLPSSLPSGADKVRRTLERESTKEGASYFFFFKPKDVVSGDFYWGSKLQNGNFALITADSTGHGVPGAIMSILNIACLNEAVKEGYTSPSEILNRTRKEIISVLKRDGSAEGGKDGMDCSLCVYDFANMKLFVAAANNPVWIVRASGVEAHAVAEALEATGADVSRTSTSGILEVKPDKMPVGKHDKQDIPFTQHEIELQKGDVVYTLTDGFPDQFGGDKGKKFMIKNLRELIVANAHLPMAEQKQLLETTFTNWIGDMEQVDDVTVIGVRI